MTINKLLLPFVVPMFFIVSMANAEKPVTAQSSLLEMETKWQQHSQSFMDKGELPHFDLKTNHQDMNANRYLRNFPAMRLAKMEKQSKRNLSPISASEKTTSLQDDEFKNLEDFVPPREIDDEIRKMVGKYRGGGGLENVAIQKARGVIETGLSPEFIGGAHCPEIDSEAWAIDYSAKRGKAALHRGVDIPQPRGTPIRAVADGVVVGRFMNEGRKDGIAVVLRHTPEQTGMKFWTYSQYTHLQEMSPLPIGARVKIGNIIGKTSNTGKMGKRVRRDALHFAILYSASPEWSNDGSVVTPKDGYFMDPTAFYRLQPPYGSQSMSKLPSAQKNIPVPYMKNDNTLVPPDTKRIWPYTCD